jgi:hypothetical protein
MSDSRYANDSLLTKKIDVINTSLYSTPRPGAIEYYDNKFYITNVGVRKVLDRSDDVLLSSVTVEDTTDETIIYTAEIGSNAFVEGNVLKLIANGIFSSVSAADEVTIRIKIGGVTTDTIVSPAANYTNACWSIDGRGTIRAVGVTGSLSYYNKLMIADKRETTCAVATIDTTGSNDINITAQWNNAKVGNSIVIAQGFLEYKN